jgi:hypothetical protein
MPGARLPPDWPASHLYGQLSCLPRYFPLFSQVYNGFTGVRYLFKRFFPCPGTIPSHARPLPLSVRCHGTSRFFVWLCSGAGLHRTAREARSFRCAPRTGHTCLCPARAQGIFSQINIFVKNQKKKTNLAGLHTFLPANKMQGQGKWAAL